MFGRRFALTPETLLPRSVMRLLPPPSVLAKGIRLVPYRLQGRILTDLANQLVLCALPADSVEFLSDRRVAIEVEDMQLRWVITVSGQRMQMLPAHSEAEVTVRGKALDLLLLASQLEDADTLFFHRRLVMTGDTSLGLHTRNFMDQLPWDQLTPGLRVTLNHFARFAKAAFDARYSAPSPH